MSKNESSSPLAGGGSGGVEAVEPSTGTRSVPTLDISSKLENPVKTARRARSKFGLNAKRTLLRIGGALNENDPRPEMGVFLTGTLPGSTPQALSAIAEESSYLVHRVKAWISTYVPAKLDFYVWELQKRGALHLHYYLYCPDLSARDRILRGWKKEWGRLLLAVGRKHGCEMFQRGFGDRRVHGMEALQAPAQQVRKNVAAYLAKYCSKNANIPNSSNAKYTPKRWWGCSRPLLALLREKTQEGVFMFAGVNQAHTWLYSLRDDTSPLAEKDYSYPHKVGVGVTVVQYFTESLWLILKEQVRSMFPKLKPTKGSHSLSSHLYETLLRESGKEFVSLSSLLSSTSQKAAAYHLNSLNQILSKVEPLSTLELRKLREVLCELSRRFTCQQMSRFQTASRSDWHQAVVRFIWRIQESRLDHGPLTSARCKELLQIFEKENKKYQASTNPAETSPEPPPVGGPEPSSPSYRQLSLL